ncbi:uncharacterized protein LOC127566659 [Pristis pectinata]|uniref:uncharacterized protein LOC127566659 n=1 Tax=Pristis pectinata TaxID=685728 RepID=UPI00223E6F8C|nr:uncharacterized protein LOC127566659 [Pristis pectinata]
MAEGADRGGDPVTTKIRKDKGPKSTLSELLTQWDDYQLFQLGKFYRNRLTEAIEERVEGLSQLLRNEGHFSGCEHEKVSQLVEKGRRTDGSKLFLNLVMEKGSQTRRVMWECFVEMRQELPKLDKILKEIQEFGPGPKEYINIARGLTELPKELKDVQQKHKRTLRQQTETLRVNTILLREKVKVFQLVDRYAEITVISTVRDRTLVEHELLARGRDHEKWRKEHLRGKMQKLRTAQLFQGRLTWSKSKSGISAAVAGVPGIGKTTMVQKIVYDWATGKIYQQFQFVFSFKFRDLNTINCTINLWNLIVFFYPYLRNVLEKLWKNAEKLLFIFDGLDEFKYKIDFGDCRRDTEPQHMCTDPDFRCKVSDIVYSLIQHKLLPGCSVLVTTRPTALNLLKKAEISVWAEILGFVGEERKEYFSRCFEDQTVAAAVFKHVEENEILYTMSYNPSYCWILGLALGPFFTQRHRDTQRVPKTITQLYSYYIYNILKNHSCKIESTRDVLLRVGQMAFTGVSERMIVFTDGDLIKYNLQPSQFLSGFLMELLDSEDSGRSTVYTFPHLIIQEFLAALGEFLTPVPGDIMERLTEAHREEDGRFEVFLRFVAGLSSPESARGLEELLGPFHNETTYRVIDWMKAEVKRQIGNTGSEAGKRSLLNTLHYLFESQNRGLAQAALGAVETLSLSDFRLNPIDCAVLSHVIRLCDTIKLLDLWNCGIESEGLQRLGPGLHKCQELRLGSNKLGDSGVKLVSAALRDPECKIQSLELKSVGLTGSGAEDLVSTLRANGSLMEINLSGNKLGNSGVKLVSAALGDPACKIQRLWLEKVGLTDSGAEELVSILTANRSLMEVNLCGNKLGISGVKLVCAALKDQECKIQRLELDGASLSRDWKEDLVSTLSTKDSFKNLDLNCLELRDSGVKLLSEALNITKYKIQRLKLGGVGLTCSCAEDLVSALRTNRSLTELDLSCNELGDSGVKLASGTLSDQECKIQGLWLGRVGLTDSGVEDLVSALSTNRSLMELELGYNSLTDRSVPALRRLILTHPSLEWIGCRVIKPPFRTALLLTEIPASIQQPVVTMENRGGGGECENAPTNRNALEPLELSSGDMNCRPAVLSVPFVTPARIVLSRGVVRSSFSGYSLPRLIPVPKSSEPKSTLSELLTQWDDYQLFQLGKFYQHRLAEAIEERVEGLSQLLRNEGHFSGPEHEDLIHFSTYVIDTSVQNDLWLLTVSIEDVLQLPGDVIDSGTHEAPSHSGALFTAYLFPYLPGFPSLQLFQKPPFPAEHQRPLLSHWHLLLLSPGSHYPNSHKNGTLLTEGKGHSGIQPSLPTFTTFPGCDQTIRGMYLLSDQLTITLLSVMFSACWILLSVVSQELQVDTLPQVQAPGRVDGPLISSILPEEHAIALTANTEPRRLQRKKITELMGKGKRTEGSKLFLSLVTEKGSQTPRVMWESFVKMRMELPKLDKILKEIQEFGPEPEEYLNIARGLTELPTELKVEHELLARGREHEKWREEHLRGELQKLRTAQLFQGRLAWSKSKSGSSAALAGVPGIGKTTMVQKIVYDWATGKIYQQFQFVFSFKFRDLNAINCTINLWNLMILTKAHNKEDGRFDIFLRFVAGLSSPGSARGLEKFLGPFSNQTTCRVIDLVKEEVKRQIGITGSEAGKRSLLNTLHYLFESQNHALAQAALGAVETLSLSDFRLNPIDCAVLSLVIGLCDTIKLLDLCNCGIESEGLQRLGPGLHKCQELRLGNNKLGDSGAKLVSASLRDPECKIQKLMLDGIGLTDTGAEDLIFALSTNRSLTELDLNYNKLGDSGVKLVFASLSDPECKIQRLWLDEGSVWTSWSEDPVWALNAKDTLMDVNLSGNKLGDAGVKLLAAALTITKYEVQKLQLQRVGFSDSGAEDLFSALSTNRSLTELDLCYNELGDSGVKLVSEDLRDPECKIQKLSLCRVGLTESGAEDLVSALRTNGSLTELDLGDNELGDSGVKLVSAVLRDPECKIKRLGLEKVNLTDSGAEDLLFALSTNLSLTELDMSSNSLTDRSVPALRHLIVTNSSLEWIRLWGNKFSRTGEKELRSMQEPRPGMRVFL